ncbi:hypothetical protein BDL97_03G137400 [Sphagnum fallax]|nr:hypothetical protein BDL97_03G137400 [Sphagnum fallax]
MAQFWLKFGVRRVLITVLLATLVGIPIVFIFHEPAALHLQSTLDNFNSHLGRDTVTEIPQLSFWEHKILGDLLKKASTPNKTVILTPLNHAWVAAGMIDIYFESFREGENIQELVNHIVIVAVDKMAYDSCKKIHPHCFILRTNGVDFSGEKVYMSEDYFKMTWRKIKFLQNVLEMGYNFIFSDADILWFRNPFTQLAEDFDVQMSMDIANEANTGFIYVVSNKRTINLFKYWYGTRERNLGVHEQDSFKKMLGEQGVKDIGLRLHLLETSIFSGYCERSNDLLHVCTMHATCCVGLGQKMGYLRSALNAWKEFKALPPHEKLSKVPNWGSC